jgi:hypothetical protein
VAGGKGDAKKVMPILQRWRRHCGGGSITKVTDFKGRRWASIVAIGLSAVLCAQTNDADRRDIVSQHMTAGRPPSLRPDAGGVTYRPACRVLAGRRQEKFKVFSSAIPPGLIADVLVFTNKGHQRPSRRSTGIMKSLPGQPWPHENQAR